MDATQDKFNEYIKLLKERTVEAIENNEGIQNSCTATLLLIFAAIDSLSKLTCKDEDVNNNKNKKHKKGVGVRIKYFLENNMGNKYATCKDSIYNLRNDIVHTGINTKAKLSKNCSNDSHLENDNDGYFVINTNIFLEDLKKAIQEIEQDVFQKGQKGTYYNNSSNRINKFSIIISENEDLAESSPGPDVQPYKNSLKD